MASVGVVGLGEMGSRVAKRLIDVGHRLYVWNRSESRVARLVRLGAVACRTPRDVAASVGLLITMVSDPAALRAVTEGADGIGAGAGESLLVAEMSTVGQAAIQRLEAALPDAVALIDAPVLGSLKEAEEGRLTILVGGDSQVLSRARVLDQLGTIIHVGELGAGSAAKLVANATLFGVLSTFGEAIALADHLGLARSKTYGVLARGPLAEQVERRRASVERAEYRPRFKLALARKDADLIFDSIQSSRLELPGLGVAQSWLVRSEAEGWGGDDYTAILATILGEKRRDESSVTTVGARRRRRRSYDGLIIDLDGVVWLGGRPIPGAVETIATLRDRGVRTLFMTNDSQSSPDDQARRLSAVGIPTSGCDVITVTSATTAFLAPSAAVGKRAYVVGSAALQEAVRAAGIETVSAEHARCAEFVVVGGHDEFDYRELSAALSAISSGASLMATGRDPAIPSSCGPVPGTGAVLAAVEAATGARADIIGKPEPPMFELARQALSSCRQIAVVGDDLNSDIRGAKAVGIDAILVLSGATSAAKAKQACVKPDWVLPELSAILTPNMTDADGDRTLPDRSH